MAKTLANQAPLLAQEEKPGAQLSVTQGIVRPGDSSGQRKK
jgi:hypothetical protein